MESEPKVEEGKIEEGKGKEKEQVYDWEGKEGEQSAVSPTPSTNATAPPVPEKDAVPALPPRPASQVQPPHGSGHPYPYPVNSYNPDDHVHPSEPEQAFRSKGCHVTKLVLSTASLVFSAGVVGLGIAVAAWGGTYSIEEGIFALTAATAGLAILWTAIDSLIVCLSHGRHRIPPGANVAGHLIIWLMAMVSVIVLALNVQYGYSRSSRTSRINMNYYEIRQLESAILVFMVALLLVHFILFIRACVETHSANLASRKNRKHIVRYVHVPVPVDASGAPISLPQGAFPPPTFTTMAAGGGPAPLVGYVPPPQGYVPPEAYTPPVQGYARPAPGVSEKSAPLAGYYAPPGAGYPQIDPAAAYAQQSAAMALHGYYGPPPAAVAGYSAQPGRRSSNSGARRSQRRASDGPSPGSGSRRESRQNPAPAPAPAPAESS